MFFSATFTFPATFYSDPLTVKMPRHWFVKILMFSVVYPNAAICADDQTEWIYPPDTSNLTINYGDTMNISWTTAFLETNDVVPVLHLWCGESNLLRESNPL